MHCAIGGSSGGTTLGPPEPTTFEVRNGWTRNVSQSRIDARVGVGVGDDLAGRFGESHVARRAQPRVRRVDDAHLRETVADLARPVLGAVVDEDDLVVGIGELLERSQVVLERVGRVVRAHDHGDARPGALPFGGERRLVEGVGDGRGRGLQTAIVIDEPELPILDGMTAAPPLVGPRERDRSARAFLEGDADVHRRDLGLVRLAFANAVGAGFRRAAAASGRRRAAASSGRRGARARGADRR